MLGGERVVTKETEMVLGGGKGAYASGEGDQEGPP